MKEKILEFLKSKLSGLPNSYIDGVAEFYGNTITEESQIDATFTDGVIDLLKHNAGLLQTEGDKRATEAAKTALKNYQEKHGLDENGKPKGNPQNPKPGDPGPAEVPEWFKAFQEEHTQLKAKLDGMEKEKTITQLKTTVMTKLKEKGIPESYIKGRNLAIEKEEEVDQLISTIESDYTTFRQELVDQGIVISVPKAAGGSTKEGEQLGKSMAENRNTNSSEGVPKKSL